MGKWEAASLLPKVEYISSAPESRESGQKNSGNLRNLPLCIMIGMEERKYAHRESLSRNKKWSHQGFPAKMRMPQVAK